MAPLRQSAGPPPPLPRGASLEGPPLWRPAEGAAAVGASGEFVGREVEISHCESREGVGRVFFWYRATVEALEAAPRGVRANKAYRIRYAHPGEEALGPDHSTESGVLFHEGDPETRFVGKAAGRFLEEVEDGDEAQGGVAADASAEDAARDAAGEVQKATQVIKQPLQVPASVQAAIAAAADKPAAKRPLERPPNHSLPFDARPKRPRGRPPKVKRTIGESLVASLDAAESVVLARGRLRTINQGNAATRVPPERLAAMVATAADLKSASAALADRANELHYALRHELADSASK